LRPVDPVIESYDKAWNVGDSEERRRLLEAATTDDCELLEPRGRFSGREAIVERLRGFTERFPGAGVHVTTNVDEHNGIGRYGWIIVDREGKQLLEGIDVFERGAEGKLRKVVMFFGSLQPL
jgi:hypothetical protein